MLVQPIEKSEVTSSDSYQLIRDEQLELVVITSQTLAGSKVFLSSYKQVVFSDCIFYACDFQGVNFENCVFDNCSFEFTHIKTCKFKNCNFENCRWMASSSINSTYEDCNLSTHEEILTSRGRNHKKSAQEDYTTDIYIQFAA